VLEREAVEHPSELQANLQRFEAIIIKKEQDGWSAGQIRRIGRIAMDNAARKTYERATIEAKKKGLPVSIYADSLTDEELTRQNTPPAVPPPTVPAPKQTPAPTTPPAPATTPATAPR